MHKKSTFWMLPCYYHVMTRFAAFYLILNLILKIFSSIFTRTVIWIHVIICNLEEHIIISTEFIKKKIKKNERTNIENATDKNIKTFLWLTNIKKTFSVQINFKIKLTIYGQSNLLYYIDDSFLNDLYCY